MLRCADRAAALPRCVRACLALSFTYEHTRAHTKNQHDRPHPPTRPKKGAFGGAVRLHYCRVATGFNPHASTLEALEAAVPLLRRLPALSPAELRAAAAKLGAAPLAKPRITGVWSVSGSARG